MLDEADPALLAPCFERLESLLAEPPLRQAFGRLGGRSPGMEPSSMPIRLVANDLYLVGDIALHVPKWYNGDAGNERPGAPRLLP
jgi:hypothetical protein